MDAVSGLLRMLKIFLFLPFRKRAVLLNIEFESLVGKDIPRITHERISLIFLLFIRRYYGEHRNASQHERCREDKDGLRRDTTSFHGALLLSRIGDRVWTSLLWPEKHKGPLQRRPLILASPSYVC